MSRFKPWPGIKPLAEQYKNPQIPFIVNDPDSRNSGYLAISTTHALVHSDKCPKGNNLFF